VRALKLRISHQLLAKPGVTLGEIKQIYSHEQAIGQCGDFLRAHPEITVTSCANTAMAAMLVAQSQRQDVAAISSKECASLYGLKSLSSTISDSEFNYTRFICIAREMEIYPGASRMSMMMELPHHPGALNELLSKFAMLGLNLTKMESRPILGSDFEFKFYFDLEASVHSEGVLALLSELEAENCTFEFLGSYADQ
jgi:chorismate mutase/prephenate dehydratase